MADAPAGAVSAPDACVVVVDGRRGRSSALDQQAIATATNHGALWPTPLSLNTSVVPPAALSVGVVGQLAEGVEAAWNWQPAGLLMVTVPASSAPPVQEIVRLTGVVAEVTRG